MSETALSRRLAQYVCGLSFDDLPQVHVSKMKLYLLDWLGSAYAGRLEPPTGIMLGVAHGLGGSPQSTIIPEGSKTMCLLAALVNGASSHVVEMDDLHRESIFHPAATILRGNCLDIRSCQFGGLQLRAHRRSWYPPAYGPDRHP